MALYSCVDEACSYIKKSLHLDSDYSVLTIVCNDRVFSAPKLVTCLISKYFHSACYAWFKVIQNPPAKLLETQTNKRRRFSGDRTPDGILPIFPLEMSITVKGYSVRRKQIPVCPAFCLTDYKVQGATLNSVILDLKDDGKSRRQDSHREYCSTYVQLSRLRSLKGLHLMQPIVMSDVAHKPDPQLLEEMRRLQALQQETLRRWQTNSYD
jgi:hypothetical protein